MASYCKMQSYCNNRFWQLTLLILICAHTGIKKWIVNTEYSGGHIC